MKRVAVVQVVITTESEELNDRMDEALCKALDSEMGGGEYYDIVISWDPDTTPYDAKQAAA